MSRVQIGAFISIVLATTLWSGVAAASGRNALVVGIGHYNALPKLANAVNDARSIADELRRSGFDVDLMVDPSTESLRAAIAELQTRTRGVSAALFYYAGHAVQFENRNYLLATDAHPESLDDVEDQGVNLSDVMQRLVGAQLRLLFIDACRDAPFAFSGESAQQHGLAPVSVGLGTVVVFSAGPEQTALDGVGTHSPFASALLSHMMTPGLELSPMLREVSLDLNSMTGGRQQMDPQDNRTAEFYFVPPGGLGSDNTSSRHEEAGVSGLLMQLAPYSGARRLLALQDRLHLLPAHAGLDAGQVEALLGDIPAPALRNYGLRLLLPEVLRPIEEPDATRLLESFDGPARGDAAELLLPCLSRPMTTDESDRIVGDTPMPLSMVLMTELQSSNKSAACPAL